MFCRSLIKLQFFVSKQLLLLNPSSKFCSATMSKSAILLVTDGTEEMEAVITTDVLRRAGIAVTVTSITGNECVKCSRDVKLCSDSKLEVEACKDFDAVILPGGAGYKNFCSSAEVGKLLKQQESKSRLIAAICAAPVALKAHGIATGKKLTSYPSTKDELVNDYQYIENEKVVVDGNLITSRGPATAFAFGLAIVEYLLNKEAAKKVADAMLYVD